MPDDESKARGASSGAPETTSRPREVVIVGGGPAGMAAAWQLRDRDLVLLETDDRLGGRLKSLPRGDYWLNFGAHLFPAEGAQVRRLIAEVNLQTVAVPGSKTALSFAGRLHTSRWIETYPFTLPLSLRERIGLVRAGLIVRWKVRSWFAAARVRPGESDADRRVRLGRFEKDRTFAQLLGRLPAPVDSIFRTAARRVPGEMDDLSAGAGISIFAGNWAGRASGHPVNLSGGSGRLGQAVGERLGDRVVLGARVTLIEPDGDGALVHYEAGGEQFVVRARQVIVATPAPVARTLVPSLPVEVARSLASVAYEPFVSMAVLTNESGPMPWDGLYAILTPGLAFNMLFNHANPLRGGPVRQKGGSLMCYAGAELARDLLDLDPEEIERRFRRDIERAMPELAAVICETIVQKWPYGNWYQTPGGDFQAMLDYSGRPTNAIHFAGDYFAPLSGSIEDATKSGTDTAQRVAQALADRSEDTSHGR